MVSALRSIIERPCYASIPKVCVCVCVPSVNLIVNYYETRDVISAELGAVTINESRWYTAWEFKQVGSTLIIHGLLTLKTLNGEIYAVIRTMQLHIEIVLHLA